MIMVALCFIVDAWQLTAISVLRGMKVVIAPTISTVIGYWLIGLPAAWLLMKLMGVKGVWAGFAVGLAATGLMLVILLFKSLTRFENQIRKQNDEDAHNHSKSANVATKTLTVL
jgi:MATE family multidrug resistance protein